MEPGYQITTDGVRGLLRVTLWGTMSDQLIAEWGAERMRAVKRLNKAPNTHLSIYDISRLQLPTKEAFTAIQSHIGNPATMARRAAVITDSTIQRLQIRRMSGHTTRTVGFFLNKAEAERWLFSEEAPEDD